MVRHLDFDQAGQLLRKDIATAKRRRQPTDSLERALKVCTTGIQMLRGTDCVLIVDSVTIDKSDLLSAYPLSAEVGRLWMENNGQTTAFETGRGYLQYKVQPAQDSTQTLQLVSCTKDGDVLSPARPVEELGTDGDTNYPFLSEDGITLYFASRNPGGLGNYDLYVTRYDADAGRFYPAENLGFPYNSYANDYLLVIDENSGLGWFASDRYQPENKVCVYTFIPHESRHSIDFEQKGVEQVKRLASLHSIADTWTADNERARTIARERLNLLRSSVAKTADSDFLFTLNDEKTCTSLQDFKTTDGRQMAQQWAEKMKLQQQLRQELEQLRDTYASGTRTERSALAATILQREKDIRQLNADIHSLEKSIRAAENKK